MILENIDWNQEDGASKVEKALIRRTTQLGDQVDNLKMETQNTRDVIGIVPITDSGTYTISDRISDNTDKLDKVELEIKILQLRAAELIDVAEFKRLITLLKSPDGENHHIALEVITNKMKEL